MEDGELKGGFDVVPRADGDPNVGLELPGVDVLPKIGVVDPVFGAVLTGVDTDVKTDFGFTPVSIGGL